MQRFGYVPLGSGSKGNSTLLVSPKAKVLVDAGLSAKEMQKRLDLFGISLDDIQAVLITHEHVDHIKGLTQIAIKRNIPILANAETARAIVQQLGCCPLFKIFTTGETFRFLDLHIHPFTIQHDTLDPVAFTVQIDQLKLGICTDLGFASSIVRHRLQGCHYLILEANHEPSMVHSSARPAFLKQRILGRCGHLSNEQSAELLSQLLHDDLRHVYLAHLSSECNCPKRALSVVEKMLQEKKVTLPVAVAQQERAAEFIAFDN